MAHLEGNWTLSQMTERNISSLAVSLEQAGSGCEKNLRIDCGRINEIDANGLQLLFIWLHCFRLLGVEAELVNLTDDLQKSVQGVGFRVCC
jgi:ABC-type transporter Mla MlaB component